MNDTVIFGFEATSTTLHTGFSKELSNTPSITYRLKHEPRQKVLTEEGVDLTDLEWSIQVYATDKYNDHVDKSGGIGFMRMLSLSASPEFYISVAIGVSAFDRLAGSVSLPDKIMIHAQGLKYGKDYEGADKIWSNPKEGIVVTEVSFSIPLVATQSSNLPDTSAVQIPESIQRATKLLYVIAAASVLIVIKLYLI
jgi:hypothetical protein